ncbi:MAG: VOC family protein [Acidobacteria bacterium]|nr:VOC family protein [Acidobacteriota bacterium]
MNQSHISLNVHDLERSVAFYTVFMGSEPVKRKEDYAKFEMRDPNLNLALVPARTPVIGPGALSHLGVRVHNQKDLATWHDRVKAAGLMPEGESGVCCYALQDKFWLKDPDGVDWEVYTVIEDSEVKGGSQKCHDAACC